MELQLEAGHLAEPEIREENRDGSRDEEVYVFPASSAQRRLWFLDQLEPNSAVYNITSGLHLKGRLDRRALELALGEIVRRHEVLRTTFELEDGEPVQVVSPNRRLEVLHVDLTALPSRLRRHAVCRELAARDSQRPFDLQSGPLLRVALLRLAPGEHCVILSLHHIVSDGWSFGILYGELKELYEAFSGGRPSPLPELPIQYADFALWQQGREASGELDRHRSFWRRQLRGELPVLALPTDRPRPAVQSFRGGRRTVALGPDLRRAVTALAQRCRGTLFLVLLGVFNLLLSRLSGQRDLIVGTAVANRERPELEALIGLFANTLVLRTELSGRPTFLELVERLRERTVQAYDHQAFAFEHLVEVLKLERDLSRNPLFQVMFMLQNMPMPESGMGGLEIGDLEVDRETSAFDLNLALMEKGGAVLGSLEYCRDLFDPSTVDRFGRYFEALTAAVVREPERSIEELPLLPPHERHQLLVEANDCRRAPSPGSLPQRIAAWAQRSPDRLAVADGHHRLTYRELEERSGELARSLLARGVRPEEPVGVSLELCADLVVALLAVLKSGAAYLPLDPAYPPRRRSLILEDSGCRLLLTSEALAGDGTPAAVEAVDPAELPGPEPGTPFVEAAPPAPEQLAYVIYTSGSTGKPKGVQVSHASLLNFLDSMAEKPGFGRRDCLLAVTTPSFDIAGLELWLPLIRGGKVVLASRDEVTDGHRLGELIGEAGATVLQATPVTWRLLLEGGWRPSAGVEILCGGEALSPDLADRLAGGESPAWNLYGPTETTIWSTIQKLAGRSPGAPVPIGTPIANTQVFVVGPGLRPLPLGAEGELLIGGAGLSRGYRGRPALTATAFIPDPFSRLPGGRLYRTGDRVRWQRDGRLEFRGRWDHQVKVRGQRIELGEVEAALCSHPAVRGAAAAVEPKGSGEGRLIAFLELEPSAAFTEGELRDQLEKTLPAGFLPSVIQVLEELPRTPNGKLDRGALPVSGIRSREVGGAFAAPRNARELQLCQLWEDLLERRPVGATDDFFQLGGHSLLAVRMMHRIEGIFAVRLPVATLFRRPTVRHLAQELEANDAPPPASPLVAIRRQGSRPPLYCVHTLGGNVLCYYDLSLHLGAEQPVSGLQATPLEGTGKPFFGPVEVMARRYVGVLREHQPEGPYLLAGWSFGGLVAFEMACQLVGEGASVPLLALLDTSAPALITRYADTLDGAVLLAGVVREHAEHLGHRLELGSEELRGLPPEEQIRHSLVRLREAGVGSWDGNEEWVRDALEALEESKAIVRSYQPRVYPGRITFFKASDADPLLAADLERSTGTVPRDPALGWSALSSRPVEIVDVPGNHVTLGLEPHVRVLAERIEERIRRALGLEPSPTSASP